MQKKMGGCHERGNVEESGMRHSQFPPPQVLASDAARGAQHGTEQQQNPAALRGRARKAAVKHGQTLFSLQACKLNKGADSTTGPYLAYMPES